MSPNLKTFLIGLVGLILWPVILLVATITWPCLVLGEWVEDWLEYMGRKK